MGNTKEIEEMRQDFRAFLVRKGLPQKRELVFFSGEDPAAWITEMDRCFEENRVPDEYKLSVAVGCFYGAALWWLQFWEPIKPFQSWLGLKERVLDRFSQYQQKEVRTKEKYVAETKEKNIEATSVLLEMQGERKGTEIQMEETKAMVIEEIEEKMVAKEREREEKNEDATEKTKEELNDGNRAAAAAMKGNAAVAAVVEGTEADHIRVSVCEKKILGFVMLGQLNYVPFLHIQRTLSRNFPRDFFPPLRRFLGVHN